MKLPTQLLRRAITSIQSQRTANATRAGSYRLAVCPATTQIRTLSGSNVVITKTKPTDELPSTTKPSSPTSNTSTIPSNNTTTTTKSDQEVRITASCWKRIHKLVTLKNNPNLYLRVFVDAGGCSGFSYQFELDDAALQDDDVVFSNNSDRLVIDEASLEMLRGSTIDYVQEMIKSSFQVTDNPQSESACGCGSSFALKNFTANPAID